MSTTTTMPAMISQASMVDTWAPLGRGSRSGGGASSTILPTTTMSAMKPAIQNAYASCALSGLFVAPAYCGGSAGRD